MKYVTHNPMKTKKTFLQALEIEKVYNHVKTLAVSRNSAVVCEFA